MQLFADGKLMRAEPKESAMTFAGPDDAARWITGCAERYMHSPANDLHMPEGPEPAFGPPLLGFASGGDALWQEYKCHVGECHWTPLEAFSLAFPGERVRAEELSVISWILPQTARTRSDNRNSTRLPAERWVRARIFGENVNTGLRAYLAEELGKQGIQAVAPVLLQEWKPMDSEPYVYASTWSERHAAYAAGLGTFGLCDGLITPAGKAMRTGSLVARLSLTPTPRPYTSHREYCLFSSSAADGKKLCGKCIKRCPAGALSIAGHDKRRCRAFVYGEAAAYAKEAWGLNGYGCGLCQVGVPCEAGIPPNRSKKARQRTAGPEA